MKEFIRFTRPMAMSLKFLKLFFTTLFFSLTVCHSNGQEILERHKVHEGKTKSTLNEKEDEQLYRIIKFHWNDDLELSLEIFNQLECMDCPPSFGHIISRSFPEQGENNTQPVTTSHCQGSLTKEDFFLTSRHCLPESLNSPGDSCEDNVLIILPRLNDSHSMRVLRCDQLVDLSPKYENLSKDDFQPDWAILKLKDKAPKRLLIPDNRGGSDNENLFAFLPLENQKTGKVSITQIQCKVIQNSLNLPEFRSENSTMAFLQCDHYITNGFSGITLFRKNEDQSHSPVATFSHLLQEEVNLNGENQFLQASKKIIASQIVCMNPTDETSEFCEFYPNKRIEYQQQLVVESLQDSKLEIDRKLIPWITDESHPIKWQSVSLENWENLPKPYLTYIKKILDEIKNKLGNYGIYYIQNLIPLYPECVRQNFVPSGKLSPEIPVQIPMIRISVLKDEHTRVVTQHEIVKLNAYLVLENNHSAEMQKMNSNKKERKFIIDLISEKPLLQKSGEAIIDYRFSHSPAIIPLCSQI